MSYTKHEFKSKEKLYASQLNEMDEQIYENSEKIAQLMQGSGSGNVITREASGEVVKITPVENTTVSVISNIKQDATYSSANRLGLRQVVSKNLIDIVGLLGGAGTVIEKYGVTCTVNENSTLTLNGTCAESVSVNIIDALTNQSTRLPFPAGTYTIPEGWFCEPKFADANWTSQGNKSNTFTVSQPFFIARFMYVIKPGQTFNNVTVPFAFCSGNVVPTTPSVYEANEYVVNFGQNIASGLFNWQTGELKDADGNIILTVGAFEPFPVLSGENTFFTGAGGTTVTYSVYDDGSTGSNTGASEVFDPEMWGLPVLYLNGDVTNMNKDNAVTLNYVYGIKSGTCTCKWQGSSSIAYNKKNYTIKFDNAFEAKEGWGEQKKYCLKANYIDHSHARNIVNAKLWGQIVKSRSNIQEEMKTLPNGGAIDGFPVFVVINDEFKGLYTFNIPKDGWMYGMGSGTHEAILCANTSMDAVQFKGHVTLDGDFDLEYATDENDTAWIINSLNNLIDACIESDGSDLDTTISSMVDLESAIDYYIFTVLVSGHDMVNRNYLLVTLDGTKWHFGAYDMDCTHGLFWDGDKWISADYYPDFNYFARNNKLMNLIKTYKKDALKSRYSELRNTVLSESNVSTEFANFIGKIPSPVYIQDVKTWTSIPNTSVNNISQIRDYYRMRVTLADKWIEEL